MTQQIGVPCRRGTWPRDRGRSRSGTPPSSVAPSRARAAWRSTMYTSLPSTAHIPYDIQRRSRSRYSVADSSPRALERLRLALLYPQTPSLSNAPLLPTPQSTAPHPYQTPRAVQNPRRVRTRIATTTGWVQPRSHALTACVRGMCAIWGVPPATWDRHTAAQY
eukprot:2371148-Rhodomonas_salina.7